MLCLKNKLRYTSKLLLIVLNIFWTTFIQMHVVPFPVKSHGGAIYFITFIDNFSQKLWIYFMRHKYKAFVKFKE